LGKNVRLTGLKRVRFKKVVRPGETIAVSVEPVPDKAHMFRFQLMIEGENACSGLMMTDCTDKKIS
jgi:acyl dehydratase